MDKFIRMLSYQCIFVIVDIGGGIMSWFPPELNPENPYSLWNFDTTVANDDGLDDDLDQDYNADQSFVEYNSLNNKDYDSIDKNTGNIPDGVPFAKNKTVIKMTGSRSKDRSLFSSVAFSYQEIHHGPIDISDRYNPKCTLWAVQSYYHRLQRHKGAVGQWNDAVNAGTLPGKTKYKQ